jgi:hypothetical protein
MAIRALWFLCTVALFAYALAASARWLGGDAARRATLLALPAGMCLGVLGTLYFGNFQLAAMALGLLGMLAIETGRTRTGAATLAFVACAKIFPGVLVVYLLAARRYRALAWTTAFGLLYTLLALVAFGPRPFVDFFTYQLPRISSGAAFAFLVEPRSVVMNLGVFGVPFKLRMLGWAGTEAQAFLLARQVSWAFTLLVVAAAAYAGRAAPPTDAASATVRGARARAGLAGVWLGLLCLASMRSPYATPGITIPLVWALSLRVAVAADRSEAIRAAATWIAALVFLPAPPPVGAATDASAHDRDRRLREPARLAQAPASAARRANRRCARRSDRCGRGWQRPTVGPAVARARPNLAAGVPATWSAPRDARGVRDGGPGLCTVPQAP